MTKSQNSRILRNVAIGAVLIAAGAGAAYFSTHDPVALRVLWLAGPIALTSVGFVVLQAVLPKDEG